MNTLMKTLAFMSSVASCSATTIVFNGCTNTNNNSSNNYLKFTAGSSQYNISTCLPKSGNTGGSVKFVIPALVNGNQVSVVKKAFYWDTYSSSSYSALNVELEFQPSIDKNTGETKYVTFPNDLSDMFAECGDEIDYDTSNKISKRRIDLRGANTSSATSMESMFYNCFRLVSVNLDNIDTSNVSSMKLMFRGCISLTSLGLSGIDTSNVTNMNGMFSRCSGLTTLDLRGFNTSKVTNMEGMFRYCYGLQALNLCNFDTSALSSTARMFADCSDLAELRVSRTFVVPSSHTNMFSNAKYNMRIIGNYLFSFEETDDDLKPIISARGGRRQSLHCVWDARSFNKFEKCGVRSAFRG